MNAPCLSAVEMGRRHEKLTVARPPGAGDATRAGLVVRAVLAVVPAWAAGWLQPATNTTSNAPTQRTTV
jgi:hypothetical protein